MQFDQARIAIRERSWADNLDLALHVLRQHFAPLMGYALLAIVPLAVVNYWLVEILAPNHFADDFWNSRTITLTVMLIMIEAPLGTSLVTLYLGQALFDEKPRPKQILTDFARSLPQLLLLQVALRAVWIGFVVTWVFPYAVWPYLNEVILLERNPLLSRRGAMSTLSRSSVLHGGNSGDYLLRGLISLFLAPLLMAGVDVSTDFVLQSLLGIELGYVGQAMQFQFVVWLVTVYFAVVRFLCYLDQRIRQEGWEVELFLRAERDRLERVPQ